MFDEEVRISRTLPTLQQLACGGTEIVVVDDGSRDRTPEILAGVDPHPLFRVVSLPTNRGKGAAVRQGALAARGDVVVFMDADLATDLAGLDPLIARCPGPPRGHRVPLDQRHRRPRRLGQAQAHGRIVQPPGALGHGHPLRGHPVRFQGVPGAHRQAALRAGPDRRLRLRRRDAHPRPPARPPGDEIPIEWHQVEGTHVRMVADPIRMALDVLRARAQAHDAATAPVLCTELSSTACTPGTTRAAVRSCAPDRLVVTTGSAVLMAAPAGGGATVDLALEHLRDAVPDLAAVDRTLTVDEFLRLADDGGVVPRRAPQHRSVRAGWPWRRPGSSRATTRSPYWSDACSR